LAIAHFTSKNFNSLFNKAAKSLTQAAKVTEHPAEAQVILEQTKEVLARL
jgi:hypothetical protein